MKFEQIKLLPILIGFFIIEPVFMELSPTYGSLIYSSLLIFYFIYELKKQNITIENIKKDFPSLKDCIKYFLMTLCLLMISVTSVSLVSNIYHLFVGSEVAEAAFESQLDSIPLWVEFTSAVIIAPIIEEFIFRGVILNKLGKKYNIYTGVFINSIIFGILHNDVFGSFIFALLVSVIYAKSKNIIIPVFIHFLNNFIVFIPLILFSNTTDDVASPNVLTEVEYFELVKSSFTSLILFLIPIMIYIFNNWHFLKSMTYVDEDDSEQNIDFIDICDNDSIIKD